VAAVTDRRGLELVNPPALGTPRGWTHGVIAPAGGRLLFVAGQTAADADGHVADPAFSAQFAEALARALAVVAAAGGAPDHVARMTVYVTDLDAYRESRPTLRDVWRRLMGTHYPAMALVEVSRLVDPEATVEIEVTAMLPPAHGTER
jgi:enamine deaminase RidA (YjgF/YER057c/UK114 family)